MNVVICTHNRPDTLATILRVLDSQTVVPFVTVVDDGDGRIELGPRSCLTRYIWNKPDGLYHRVGKYNMGLGLVQGKVILLDDDCIPKSDYFIEAYEAQLDSYDIVRGAWLHEGEIKEIPWFSTANIGMRVPWLFDPMYDGIYGYDDHDFGKYIEKLGLAVGKGAKDTAVEHVGQPFSGDRVATQKNIAYYKAKWGLE